MGRADKTRFNQEQQAQLQANNEILGQAAQDRAAARGLLMPQLQDILAHPGYSDSEQQRILGATDAGIGGSFGDAQQQLASRASRTGNAAGLIPAEEEMGRLKAQQMSATNAALSKNFADAAIQQRDFALNGLAGLMQSATPLMQSSLASSTGLIGDQARLAATPAIGTQLALAGLHAIGGSGGRS